MIPLPPFSVKGSGTRLLGSWATGSGLPVLPELQSKLLGGAAVWEILGPTVLGAPGSQPCLAHQLLDRKWQQHASHRTQSSPTRKLLQVYAKGKRKSEGVSTPLTSKQVVTTLHLLEGTNWPALSGGWGCAAQLPWLELASQGQEVTLVQSSPPSDLHLYRSLEKFYTK